MKQVWLGEHESTPLSAKSCSVLCSFLQHTVALPCTRGQLPSLLPQLHIKSEINLFWQHGRSLPPDTEHGHAIPGETEPLVVAGVVKLAPGAGRSGDVVVGIHPQCRAHTGQPHSACNQVSCCMPGYKAHQRACTHFQGIHFSQFDSLTEKNQGRKGNALQSVC